MAAIDQRKLGQILIDEGIITLVQLEEALAEQRSTGRFFGEILVSRGEVTEEEIARSLSEQLGFAYVDAAEITIESQAIEMIPKEVCLKHTMIPLFISQNMLTLAMANALDMPAVDRAQSLSGLRVRPVFACPSTIRSAIEKHYGKDEADASGLSNRLAVDIGDIIGRKPAPAEPTTSLRQAASIASVVERVNQIIEQAIGMGASDIHLEPEREKFNCRYRVDGILRAMPGIPLDEQAAVVSRIKIMAEIDIAEKRLPQDGRIRMFLAGRDVDLRVSTFPSIHGENLVIRILDRSGGLIHLSDLGFSKEHLDIFSHLIRRPYGMILVTGPTGSGKTTTLYGALSQINTLEKNIITLEDPVEYELPNIRQSQINVKAGLTFANGLRSIVRQDPDIIMIGEIRDKETADIAIHAALTGHLVFSTLHTNDAPSAAARLIDMGIEPFLVASSMIGILAQRLIRTLCPHCKETYAPLPEVSKELNLPKNVFKENGCAKCKNLGYTGRTGIFELLVPNDRIKSLITQKASASVIRQEAVKAGMKALRDSGREKIAKGLTSVSEVMRVTEDAGEEGL